MIAVIASAGVGLRLRPITEKLPKVMVPLNGKPLLWYHIQDLKKIGVDTFLINLHYLPLKIKGYFGDGSKFGVRIIYSNEPELFGTAGLLNNFRTFLTERFWFIAGDAFLPGFNFKKMEKFHVKHRSVLTVALKKRIKRIDCDFVEIDGSSRLTKFYFKPHKNKPPTNLDTCMVYLVEPKVLSYLPRTTPFDFSHQFLPLLVSKKLPIYGYVTAEYIEDVGTKERYRKIKSQFRY